MEDLLIELLETYGYPVYQQGSLSADEPYPDSFFTFWNNSAEGKAFYDNEENAILWDDNVYFYSSDPLLVNTKLLEVKQLLREHGFIVTGAGFPVPSDEVTHTGRGIGVTFLEVIKK